LVRVKVARTGKKRKKKEGKSVGRRREVSWGRINAMRLKGGAARRGWRASGKMVKKSVGSGVYRLRVWRGRNKIGGRSSRLAGAVPGVG
jgi:hypothetical protein